MLSLTEDSSQALWQSVWLLKMTTLLAAYPLAGTSSLHHLSLLYSLLLYFFSYISLYFFFEGMYNALEYFVDIYCLCIGTSHFFEI